MAVAQLFEAYPATFTDGVTPRHLAQMQGFSISPAVQLVEPRIAGSVDRVASITGRAQPMATLRTRDLAGVFGFLSATVGYNATSGATFRLQQRQEADAFDAGSTHVTYTSTKGVLYPQTISASLDGSDGATLALAYKPFYDGSTKPFVKNVSQSLAGAPAPAFNSLFFLHSAYENGVEIQGLQSVTVDFGLSLIGAPQTAGPYDRTAAFNNRFPTLRFGTVKADEAGDAFNRAINTSFAVYLQKGAANDDRVAVGTAQHVKVSCTAGSIQKVDVGGDAPGNAVEQWEVHPVGQIAISVASAIP